MTWRSRPAVGARFGDARSGCGRKQNPKALFVYVQVHVQQFACLCVCVFVCVYVCLLALFQSTSWRLTL